MSRSFRRPWSSSLPFSPWWRMLFSMELMASILNHTEKVKGSSMSGIGLPNVDRRIKLNYGEEYGLTIESQEGEFTEITIKMPLEYECEGESR